MMADQLQLALDRANMGDLVGARQIAMEVVKREPRNGRAWYVLSQVVGDREKAIYCLNKVLEIHPGNLLALEGLRKWGVAVEIPASSRRQQSAASRKKTSLWPFLIVMTGLVLIFAYGANWWGWGPCGRRVVNQSLRDMAEIGKEIVAVLEKMPSTGQNAIPGRLADMKSLQDRLIETPVPRCMQLGKSKYVEALQHTIDAMALAMNNYAGILDNNIMLGMELSFNKMDEALAEFERIGACAPFCVYVTFSSE